MLHSPHLVTATDLTERHYRLEERGLFPDLVQRLILSSDLSVRGLQFRSYESIAISGWDGIVEQADGSTFVPTGASRWEIGTNVDAQSKVKSDFEKRNAPPAPPKKRGRPKKNPPATSAVGVTAVGAPTAPPVGIVSPEELVFRGKTTLVFVIGREWPDNRTWAAAQTKANEWKAIRVFDASDIYTWLTQHPGLHLWLSRQMGKPVRGTNDLENWWADWAFSINIRIQPDWLIAGRQQHRDRLIEWLKEGDAIFPIFGKSTREAQAFLAACVMSLAEDDRLTLLGRIVLVAREDVWEELVWEEKKLILVFDFLSERQYVLCSMAARQGHRVIITNPQQDERNIPSNSLLPPIGVEELRALLIQQGMPAQLASTNTQLASQLFTGSNSQVMKWPFLNPNY
ncbi:hypothetical protein I2I05_19140 [Hymenobacter sp. BT683]|uniref:Uncharacterized protein n=1 Tax=Hymenobacter jeongseonensis TaxID=2791027 RepID=A0ABS0IMS9_9BACT|nr:hypothetical protein [Hymenobacter jeongseonensis]MBF9239517.1 hypothetical protein [Hymenobacter jeongseonensis]